MNSELKDLKLTLEWMENEFSIFFIINTNITELEDFFHSEKYEYKKIISSKYDFDLNLFLNNFLSSLSDHNVLIELDTSCSNNKSFSKRILSSLNKKRTPLERTRKHIYIKIDSDNFSFLVEYAPDLFTIRQKIIDLGLNS